MQCLEFQDRMTGSISGLQLQTCEAASAYRRRLAGILSATMGSLRARDYAPCRHASTRSLALQLPLE